MTKKTSKQKRQEEEYLRRMNRSVHESEDLFGLSNNQTRHVNKSCSVCGHHWAWYSSDFGDSWQCSEHRKSS